ncbi:Gfo/Idh/MocA family protein [Paenibacillus hamazuiensis]|uniref:Gfo/Idh/MocA family protein n=1 Tax=Paenibacillus hamazuiensis TaxID=2936508 RepID=UPI00200E84A8|nr:Gfo/Idh/MocA family oxidoreductase [Paenibacillus hamazuiensis]
MTAKRVKWGVLSAENSDREAFRAVFNRTSNAELVHKEYVHFERVINDPDIDAVYIQLPSKHRLEWIRKAAHAGKHILCEKPAALHVQDAAQIMNVCKENGVIFLESFPHLFHPQHEKAKQLIQSGLIGEVKMMRAGYSFPARAREDELDAGILYHVGSDCINSVRYIFESEPVGAVAIGESNPAGMVQTVGVILHYPGHLYAMVDCSSEMTMRNEYEVVGTEGVITLPFAYRPDLNGGDGMIVIQTKQTRTELIVKDDRNVHLIDHISDCILQGAFAEYIGGEYLLKNMKVLDAIMQSLRHGSMMTQVERQTLAEDSWNAECGIAFLLRR